MKKLIIMGVMLALMAAVGVVPAVAAARHGARPYYQDPYYQPYQNFYAPFYNNLQGYNPYTSFNPYNYNPYNYNQPYNGGGGISQGIANNSTTGDVNNSFTATSTGNNSNQCVTPLQFGNTGSQQNAQGVLQYSSFSGDINETGGSFVFAPQLNASCNQYVQQSSAASSGW